MKESKLFKGFIAIFAMVAFAPTVASADAKADLKGVSVKVSYADLDLEKRQDAKTLYRRLQQASKKACGVRSLSEHGSIQHLAHARQCYRDALAEAVAEIDNELLSQIHNS